MPVLLQNLANILQGFETETGKKVFPLLLTGSKTCSGLRGSSAASGIK